MSDHQTGNRPNPDNRDDNVERIQRNITNTIRNMEAAEEMMAETPDQKLKHDLEEKNERRRESLTGQREEIREEALAREQRHSK